jgi:hypothetical protein
MYKTAQISRHTYKLVRRVTDPVSDKVISTVPKIATRTVKFVYHAASPQTLKQVRFQIVRVASIPSRLSYTFVTQTPKAIARTAVQGVKRYAVRTATVGMKALKTSAVAALNKPIQNINNKINCVRTRVYTFKTKTTQTIKQIRFHVVRVASIPSRLSYAFVTQTPIEFAKNAAKATAQGISRGMVHTATVGAKALRTTANVTKFSALKTAKIGGKGFYLLAYSMAYSGDQTISTAGQMIKTGRYASKAVNTAVKSSYKTGRATVVGVKNTINGVRKFALNVKSQGLKKTLKNGAANAAKGLGKATVKAAATAAKTIVQAVVKKAMIPLVCIIAVAALASVAAGAPVLGVVGFLKTTFPFFSIFKDDPDNPDSDEKIEVDVDFQEAINHYLDLEKKMIDETNAEIQAVLNKPTGGGGSFVTPGSSALEEAQNVYNAAQMEYNMTGSYTDPTGNLIFEAPDMSAVNAAQAAYDSEIASMRVSIDTFGKITIGPGGSLPPMSPVYMGARWYGSWKTPPYGFSCTPDEGQTDGTRVPNELLEEMLCTLSVKRSDEVYAADTLKDEEVTDFFNALPLWDFKAPYDQTISHDVGCMTYTQIEVHYFTYTDDEGLPATGVATTTTQVSYCPGHTWTVLNLQMDTDEVNTINSEIFSLERVQEALDFDDEQKTTYNDIMDLMGEELSRPTE